MATRIVVMYPTCDWVEDLVAPPAPPTFPNYGRPPAVTHPPLPHFPKLRSELSTYCSGVDLISILADGLGGFFRESKKVNSTECGFTNEIIIPVEPPTVDQAHQLYLDDFGRNNKNLTDGSNISALYVAKKYSTGDGQVLSGRYNSARYTFDFNYGGSYANQFGIFLKKKIKGERTRTNITIDHGNVAWDGSFEIGVLIKRTDTDNDRQFVSIRFNNDKADIVYSSAEISNLYYFSDYVVNTSQATTTSYRLFNFVEYGFEIDNDPNSIYKNINFYISGLLIGTITFAVGLSGYWHLKANEVIIEGFAIRKNAIPVQTISLKSIEIIDLNISSPEPAGIFLFDECIGYNRVGTYTNGLGGTTSTIIKSKDVSCGYVTPPYGTVLSIYCTGIAKWGTYANGHDGIYNELISHQHEDCGYIAPPEPPQSQPVVYYNGDYKNNVFNWSEDQNISSHFLNFDNAGTIKYGQGYIYFATYISKLIESPITGGIKNFKVLLDIWSDSGVLDTDFIPRQFTLVLRNVAASNTSNSVRIVLDFLEPGYLDIILSKIINGDTIDVRLPTPIKYDKVNVSSVMHDVPLRFEVRSVPGGKAYSVYSKDALIYNIIDTTYASNALLKPYLDWGLADRADINKIIVSELKDAPPIAVTHGTILNETCVGTTKTVRYADGMGGEYTWDFENSSDC